MTIPPHVHFCWIGSLLPWAYAFAILSAVERSDMERVTLHHTDALQPGPVLQALRDAPGVVLSRIDPVRCLAEVGALLELGNQLVELYQALDSKVQRSDVLRAAILYLHGGIYLDLDTITVADFHPLLEATQFAGYELIVWPHGVRSSRSPLVWARHLSLDLARRLLRWMPYGWAAFRRIERFYVRGINNAVMGAAARSDLFADYLRAMLALPRKRRMQPYALGPTLLQQVIGREREGNTTIHSPWVFYPLPPEISEHWFRIGRGLILDDVLSAETRVVHWYASVHTGRRTAEIDPNYVHTHRADQLYSMLVHACIRNVARWAPTTDPQGPATP